MGPSVQPGLSTLLRSLVTLTDTVFLTDADGVGGYREVPQDAYLGSSFPYSFPCSFPCFSAFGRRTAEAFGSPDESPTPAAIRDPRLSCFYQP